MRDTEERGAETQAKREADSMQGARRGTGSRNSRIAPWAKGRRETAEPPRDPHVCVFKYVHPFMFDQLSVFMCESVFISTPLCHIMFICYVQTRWLD